MTPVIFRVNKGISILNELILLLLIGRLWPAGRMDLPSIISAVFLVAKSFGKTWAFLSNI
jgi:hypothetical protein